MKETDALPAGPELDAEVARRVMGWTEAQMPDHKPPPWSSQWSPVAAFKPGPHPPGRHDSEAHAAPGGTVAAAICRAALRAVGA